MLGDLRQITSCLRGSISFFVFFFGCPEACGVPGPGSDPSHNCDLSRSCGNAGSLTHCAGPGIEPHPSAPKTPPILLCHSRNAKAQFINQSNENNRTFHSRLLGRSTEVVPREQPACVCGEAPTSWAAALLIPPTPPRVSTGLGIWRCGSRLMKPHVARS